MAEKQTTFVPVYNFDFTVVKFEWVKNYNRFADSFVEVGLTWYKINWEKKYFDKNDLLNIVVPFEI